MSEASNKRFQQFVDNIHFGDESYDSDPNRNEDDEITDAPLEEYDGLMYVTTGDEIPWLVIYGPNNFGISLKPALALYWLDEIRKYYETRSSNQKAIK